jgi:antitoxin ParD1/3/4
VRDALREWKMKRAIQLQEITALKADIDKGDR